MGVKKQLCLKRLSIVFLTSILLLVAVFEIPTSSNKSLKMVQQFGVSTALATVVARAVDGGMAASTAITIIGGLATGGIGLIAAAGRQALMVFLRAELRKRGERAFIAW